jgi:hypothetical protein
VGRLSWTYALHNGYSPAGAPMAGATPEVDDRTTAERAAAAADGRRTDGSGADRAGGQRTGGPGRAGQGAAGGGRRGGVHRGGPGSRAALGPRGGPPGGALQPGGHRRGGPAPRRRGDGPVRPGGTGAHPAGIPARARPGAGRDGDVVADDIAAGVTAGARWPTRHQHLDDPADAVGRRVHLATEPDLVPDRHGPAQARGRDGGRGHRPRRRCQKKRSSTRTR